MAISTSSVIAFKFADGILTATDTHGSQGGLSKSQEVIRTFKFQKTLVSFSGNLSDILFLERALRYEIIKDGECTPLSIFHVLQRVLYHRRSRLEPLQVSCVVAGYCKPSTGDFGISTIDNYESLSKTRSQNSVTEIEIDSTDSNTQKKLFLRCINEKGNFWDSEVVCTGLASHFITPFLRSKKIHSKEDAVTVAQEALRMLHHRDTTATGRVVIGVVQEDFCEISGFLDIDSVYEDWRAI